MNLRLLLQQEGLSVRQHRYPIGGPLKTVQDWVYRGVVSSPAARAAAYFQYGRMSAINRVKGELWQTRYAWACFHNHLIVRPTPCLKTIASHGQPCFSYTSLFD